MTDRIDDMQRTNWAGNYRYIAGRLHEPPTVEELQTVMADNPLVKAIGSRHSFNEIADTEREGVQVSLARFNSIDVDRAARTVTAGSGVRYGDLVPVLQREGLALHNLASLPHISVAGAIATATHGSGLRCGNLSTAVCALEWVAGTGEIVRLSKRRDGNRFLGAVVGLGATGVVTRVTLDLEPAYEIAQRVYLDLPFSELEHGLDEIFSAGYSVSLFTDWQHSRATQVWIKQRTDRTDYSPAGASFFGAKAAAINVHPLPGHEAAACTQQLGVPGPWCERLPHFRMSHTPSSGQELQSEYFVPLEQGYEAIRAIEALREEIAPLLHVSELRTVAADELWLSMAWRRPSLAIHFTWKPDWSAVRNILPRIEERLEVFGARPHWGKLFRTAPAALAAAYPRLAEFRVLIGEFDPAGKLRNGFLCRNVYGEDRICGGDRR